MSVSTLIPALLVATIVTSSACSGSEGAMACDLSAAPEVTINSPTTGSLLLQLKRGGVVGSYFRFKDYIFLLPDESRADAIGNPNLPRLPRSGFAGLPGGEYEAGFELVEQRQDGRVSDVDLDMMIKGRNVALGGPIGCA